MSNPVIVIASLLGGANAEETAARLLRQFGGINGLLRASDAALRNCGLGDDAIARLKAAAQLSVLREERPQQIVAPKDVVNLVLGQGYPWEQEHMWVLLLDARHHVREIVELYRGSTDAITLRVAEVFREAVRTNTSAIIVVHNHPSGDPAPSPEDIALTKKLVSAGQLLDIRVVDHIIIGTPSRWISIADTLGMPEGG